MNNRTKIFIDFDGTLCGLPEWYGFCRNTCSAFTSGLLMVVPKQPWSILTDRPRKDKWIIEMACKKYKLNPDEIITQPTFLYRFNSREESANWKSSILMEALNDLFIVDVIYVDDDPEVLASITKQPGLTLCNSKTLSFILKEINNGEG